ESVFGTLLDYLPAETIFLLSEPAALEDRATEYAGQIPAKDSFFISWEDFQAQAIDHGMVILGLNEAELSPDNILTSDLRPLSSLITGLDAFRPLSDRRPEPQVAEAQRREFFSQLHRWTR